ncbi:carboxypeptidase regulatory-like domain-containing protein [Leptospira congkakensis]|uniref:Carboxypeptidase regulatory-like domain-containing protein n=1 Tax=Leptospira congkakensis TaxID=2484932 RepID=A0A4Z1A826_9LEPT|nr:carboxypeptidase regulatory-like domain-containing protein [Leptospira congkakensis]TGL85538.1 carboxypeptidase regulatory-like domain-containing protein [Leptospira congkakensis]TGL92297.1 carboxypeptidase regulatory-like domain-containing protein [Leptospira congkakensis]TGM00043.1 carboxypeptidase regulatory-like domain-containing protein [Leptospira congkakensis]
MSSRFNLLSVAVFLSLGMLLGNCYFNPAVQMVVNPEIEENTNPASKLGIAAALTGSRTVNITGQVVNANGAAVANGALTILSQINPSPRLTSTTSLNEGGRFYLTLSLGETTFRVEQSGSVLFTFTISIPSPGVVSVVASSVAGAGAINMEFYSEGSIPNYFDIVSTSPISEGTTFEIWPTYLYITFSENLDVPGDKQTFLDANILTYPTKTLDGEASEITNNVLTIYNASAGSIGPNIFIFGSGIKSAAGKTLKPRTLTFLCQPSCSGS